MSEENPEVTVEKLQEQIDNLNKGIATYRGESKVSKAEVARITKESTEKIEGLEKKIKEISGDDDDNKKKEVKLNPKDQEKLEAWAKEQGFVTKKEMDEQKLEIFNASLKNIESQAIDEFLKSHPIYDKDEEWAKIKEQFDLYKTPTSLSGYRQLLAKIHKELNPNDEGSAKARAEIEKKQRLGLGGGNQKGLEGGAETIESLQAKYPRLSRAQIEARVGELNALYKDKKK